MDPPEKGPQKSIKISKQPILGELKYPNMGIFVRGIDVFLSKIPAFMAGGSEKGRRRVREGSEKGRRIGSGCFSALWRHFAEFQLFRVKNSWDFPLWAPDGHLRAAFWQKKDFCLFLVSLSRLSPLCFSKNTMKTCGLHSDVSVTTCPLRQPYLVKHNSNSERWG